MRNQRNSVVWRDPVPRAPRGFDPKEGPRDEQLVPNGTVGQVVNWILIYYYTMYVFEFCSIAPFKGTLAVNIIVRLRLLRKGKLSFCPRVPPYARKGIMLDANT
jgi:hypothetical protein